MSIALAPIWVDSHPWRANARAKGAKNSSRMRIFLPLASAAVACAFTGGGGKHTALTPQHLLDWGAMTKTRDDASSSGGAKKPTAAKKTTPQREGQQVFQAVDGFLGGLDEVKTDQLVTPTPETTEALQDNYAKLVAVTGGSDEGVQIWVDAPTLEIGYRDFDRFMIEALQRHKNNHGGWAALAARGSTHAAGTRYDVKQYEKHGRTIIECTLPGHSSGMSGSGGREFGEVVVQMKEEGHPVAVNLLAWLRACEELKGMVVDKFSIQKVVAGGKTAKHGDADYGAKCRDVITILANESATKYLALCVGEVRPGTDKGKTRYPRSRNVRLLGTLAQRHGQTYTGTRMAMGVDAILASQQGRDFYAFHQVLPGSPLTPMWNIVVDYK